MSSGAIGRPQIASVSTNRCASCGSTNALVQHLAKRHRFRRVRCAARRPAGAARTDCRSPRGRSSESSSLTGASMSAHTRGALASSSVNGSREGDGRLRACALEQRLQERLGRDFFGAKAGDRQDGRCACGGATAPRAAPRCRRPPSEDRRCRRRAAAGPPCGSAAHAAPQTLAAAGRRIGVLLFAGAHGRCRFDLQHDGKSRDSAARSAEAADWPAIVAGAQMLTEAVDDAVERLVRHRFAYS